MRFFHGFARRFLYTITLILAVALASSCTSVRKSLTGWAYQRVQSKGKGAITSMRSNIRHVLNDDHLREMHFEGSAACRNIEVAYQRGLENQASYIARHLASDISDVEERIGLEIPTRCKVYLIRTSYVPQNIDFRRKTEDYAIECPLFVQHGNESCGAILSGNALYPFVFIHELVEMTLMDFRRDSPVRTDISLAGFITISNGTRWFREGLANYAAYLVQKRNFSHDREAPKLGRLVLDSIEIAFGHPLSSLSKAKTGLFSWDQFDAKDRTLYQDYYSAALGLFLLIEHRFGEDAVRTIVTRLHTRAYLDGDAITEIVDESLSNDIKKMVARFCFPETGLTAARATPALAVSRALSVTDGLFVSGVQEDSMASRAGFREGDVIVDVDGQPIDSSLSFEVALLNFVERRRARVTVDRFGERLILELKE